MNRVLIGKIAAVELSLYNAKGSARNMTRALVNGGPREALFVAAVKKLTIFQGSYGVLPWSEPPKDPPGLTAGASE